MYLVLLSWVSRYWNIHCVSTFSTYMVSSVKKHLLYITFFYMRYDCRGFPQSNSPLCVISLRFYVIWKIYWGKGKIPKLEQHPEGPSYIKKHEPQLKTLVKFTSFSIIWKRFSLSFKFETFAFYVLRSFNYVLCDLWTRECVISLSIV